MTLKELNIINFKNIAEATLTFTSGFNCFVGNNGVGKTNVLDAIYHLSMCKSYFNLPDLQNIRHEEPFFVVQGKYERGGEELTVYCGVKRGQKKVFKKNQKAYDKLSEHIGLIPLVMISPEDFILIDGGSEERRKLVDGIISQCDRVYLHRLIRYNKALTQRNMLLKSAAGKFLDPEMLEVWNEQLAEHGEAIRQKRKIGSQGQKKTFLIALKLAQYHWLHQMSEVKPLLLLDDIFDKLDADRVEQIVKIVGGEMFGQVFITDTNRGHIDDILRAQAVDYKLFTVTGGEIS